jgi:hypothetical protein
MFIVAAVAPAFGQLTIAANPESVDAGEPVVITWKSPGTSAFIDGVGVVRPSGSKTITPTGSMTYTLVSQGPSGIGYASVRIPINGQRGEAIFPDPNEFPQGVSDRRSAIAYPDFLDVAFKTLQDQLKFRVRGEHLPQQTYYVFFTDREPRPELVKPSDRGIRARRVAYSVRVEEPRAGQAIPFEVKALVEYQRSAEATWRAETDPQLLTGIVGQLKQQLLTAGAGHP